MMRRFLILIVGLLTGTLAWAAAVPSELNITYVKAPFNLQNMVIKTQGLLEKEFEKEGVKINWIPIKVGINQVRGLMAGDIDMVSAMNTSTLLIANGAGNRILIADGVARPNDIFAIVASKTSSIRSVRDLKGKRVVGPKGTVVHHLLLAALAKEGMNPSDVEFVSMNLPASLTTLLMGSTDAALLVGSGIQKAVGSGHFVLTRAQGLIDTNLVMAVSERFAKAYPDVVRRVVKINRHALTWIRTHQEEALSVGSKELAISVEQARELASWSHFYSELSQSDIDAMNKNQKFLLKEKMMKRSVDVTSLLFL